MIDHVLTPNTFSNTKKLMKKHLLILFVISLCFRLGYIVLLDASNPHYGMSPRYAEQAYILASGNGYTIPRKHELLDDSMARLSKELYVQGEKIGPTTPIPHSQQDLIPEYWRTPGYPCFLYLVYKLFGEPIYLHASIVQAVIGAFLPLIVFFLAKLLFGKKAAMVSMWLCAVYPPLVFIQLQPLPDGFLILFILLALCLFSYGLARKRELCFILAALSIGFGFLFRPETIVLIPLFSVVLLICWGLTRASAKGAIAIVVCSCLFIVPWVIRNHHVTGHWYVTTGAGTVAWMGIAERNNKWGAVLLDEHSNAMAKNMGFDTFASPEADKWLKQKVANAFREDPLYFVVSSLYRIPMVIATPFHWGYKNPARTKGFRKHFRLVEKLDLFQTIFQNKIYMLRAFWDRWITAAISFLAFVSMIVVAVKFRKNKTVIILFFCIPISFMLLRIGIRALPRYLTIMIPFQMMALATAACLICNRIKSHARFNV